MTNEEIVKALKAHALKHYNDGWDVIVECWETKDLLKVVEEEGTFEKAKKAIAAIVHIHEDRRMDAEKEMF